MKNLSAATKGILRRVEELSGKGVEFLRDDSLTVLTTMQTARGGAPFHVVRYRPSNEPLDYFIAYQAGFLLRLFQNPPHKRFDFVPDSVAGAKVQALLSTSLNVNADARQALPGFAEFVAQWALMNLRSLPIGMRTDHWIATEYPELKDLQRSGIAVLQQQNMDVLGYRLGQLSVPTTLLAANAAYALFADRLLAQQTYAIPYEAAGTIDAGRDLLRIWDELPAAACNDCQLVDRWASAMGMGNWYRWSPYQP